MVRDLSNGFCMALADSVPGVSGGTVAFIMGFYDDFIGSIHNVVFGNREEKKAGLKYLVKLGCGWAVGMSMAVLLLSFLFQQQIYMVSSLFIGFIAGAIPLIVWEERASLGQIGQGMIFLLLGAIVVAGITWLNGSIHSPVQDLGQFTLAGGLWLFVIGMVAISAMFLPGISGSTLLLIFGAYFPVITAVREFMLGDFSYGPGLLAFVAGIVAGAALVVRLIRNCLEKFRAQTVYMILGMMLGSFYAIIMGPATLAVPKAPMSLGSFHILACVAGVALVLLMQAVKEKGVQENVYRGGVQNESIH